MGTSPLTDARFLLRTMLDDVAAWGRVGYPPVAIGRYKDAAYEIDRLRKEQVASAPEPAPAFATDGSIYPRQPVSDTRLEELADHYAKDENSPNGWWLSLAWCLRELQERRAASPPGPRGSADEPRAVLLDKSLRQHAHDQRIAACGAWSAIAKLPIELDEAQCQIARANEDRLRSAIDELADLSKPSEPAAEYAPRCFEYKHHSPWPGQEFVWSMNYYHNGQEPIESRQLYIRKQPETKTGSQS